MRSPDKIIIEERETNHSRLRYICITNTMTMSGTESESELKNVLEKYLSLQEEAMKKLSVNISKGSFLEEAARDFLEMINNYIKDSLYFSERGDYIRSFAAINYAYGWIDAGVRIGLLDGKQDHRLFTIYK